MNNPRQRRTTVDQPAPPASPWDANPADLRRLLKAFSTREPRDVEPLSRTRSVERPSAGGLGAGWPPLPLHGLGIGVITYNRLPFLQRCLAAVLNYTQTPSHLVVADDGSTDGTVGWCRSVGIPVVTGLNGGCAVNKNRALGSLLTYTDCDPILLLEEDAIPNVAGWEVDWIRCCLQFGHVNYATPFHLREHLVGGTGTPLNPWLCTSLSGQCTITSRAELLRVGYLDSRFAGYGEEHIEWSRRFFPDWPQADRPVLAPLLSSGLTLAASQSYFDQEQRDRNREVFTRILGESVYRDPFRADGQGGVTPPMFWAEQRQAASIRRPAGPEFTPYRTDCFLAASARPCDVSFDDVVVTMATRQLKESQLRAMLNSLELHGGGSFTTVVLYEEDGTDWDTFLAPYGAVGIPFRLLRSIPNAKSDWFVKGLLYSVTEFVRAKRYVCLDCDTLVLGPLTGLWDALSVLKESSLLFAFDGNGIGLGCEADLRPLRLRDYVSGLYGGRSEDLARLLPAGPSSVADYRLLLNSGVFAGRPAALQRLSATLRGMMPGAWEWLCAAPESPREQFLVNLAVADGTGVELDATYNVQLHEQVNRALVTITPDHRAFWQGRPVRILHFSGPRKDLILPDLQEHYRTWDRAKNHTPNPVSPELILPDKAVV